MIAVFKRAAAALVLGVCAVGLSACGSHNGAETAGTGSSPGRPRETEATIVKVTCTAAQLAHRQPPIVYRPSGLGTRRAPLVIALHGAMGTGRLMAELTGFEGVAARRGFVAVFPSACDLRRPWGAGQDLYYLDSLIRSQISTGRIDPHRVYIAGFSAGGAEAWRMACMFGRDLAGIAVVSDQMGFHVRDACVLSKPLRQLLMVGTADGERWTGVPGHSMSAIQTTVWWRDHNRCSGASVDVRPIPRVIERTWTSCAGGSRVGLYEVLGATHVWPPAGIGAPPDYNASEAVWRFLSAGAGPS